MVDKDCIGHFHGTWYTGYFCSGPRPERVYHAMISLCVILCVLCDPGGSEGFIRRFVFLSRYCKIEAK